MCFNLSLVTNSVYSVRMFKWLKIKFRLGVCYGDVFYIRGIMLVFCGSLCLIYCYHYMGCIKSLFYEMFIFIMVMLFLVKRYKLITTLILWEYLGLVRFILILFYCNRVSLQASVITMVVSRLGDVSLFLLFAICFINSNFSGLLLRIMLFFIVGRKSAFYPFISWLLEAMRAPTPVRALVHSSTLVAAGVWFGAYYYSLFIFRDPTMILICSLVTIIITGVCSLIFRDLKKLVALSTCKKISWCLIFMIFGGFWISLMQLLRHGVCKCLLFMLIGDLMGFSGGSQDYKGVRLKKNFWKIIGLFIIIMGLSGFYFFGVFFSKHLFISYLSRTKYAWYILVLICFSLTMAYSMRMFMLCLGSYIGNRVFLVGKFYYSFWWVPIMVVLKFVLRFFITDLMSVGNGDMVIFVFVVLFGWFLGLYFFLKDFGLSWWVSRLFGLDIFIYQVKELLSILLSLGALFHYRWDYRLVCFLLSKKILGLAFLGCVGCVSLIVLIIVCLN